tara:strand:+ start:489 stop:1322 length:834 start_codon:yes stop_codon:yes gene_type:complete
MLKQRIITALVLAPIVIACVFFLPPAGFSVFLIGTLTIGGWEWANLAHYAGWQRYLYALAIALLLIAVSFLLEASSFWALAILVIAAIWWMLALFLVVNYPLSQRYWSSNWVLTLLGPVMLVPGYVGLMQLKGTTDSQFLILLLFFLIWGADIGAYFSGRRWGAKKLAPEVSPGKSWAGFYGGVTLATLIAMAMCVWLGKPLILSTSGLVFLLGCILVVLFSVLGDLTESMFKRQRGIKDSSQLLPGHGGVLDRLDSLLAGAPIFALFVLLFDWQSV